MKRSLLFIVAGFSVVNASSQTSANLDANNINAQINSYGNLFTVSGSGSAGFEAPKNSGVNSIYASHFWIGGKDMLDSIYVAAASFYSSTSDFQPGPIMDSLSYPLRYSHWNNVWKVDQTMIDYHIANYSSASYVMPTAIAYWPAHGDISYGEPGNVAPFVDVNSNGIYEPLNGDFPEIKGRQAIFQVFNDDKVHENSDGPKMKIEVHCMAYVFDCLDDSALQNTVFVNYKIINRGTKSFSNTAFGFFSDIDLGNYADDYMGCDVSRGMYYGYNGDAVDQTASGVNGYGTNLPMQGVLFLGGGYVDSDGSDNPIVNDYASMISSNGIVYEGQWKNYNDGIVDNERSCLSRFIAYSGSVSSLMSDPTNDELYYSYMTAVWPNGDTLCYSTIFSSASDTSCYYVFPGNSDPAYIGTLGVPVSPWSEISASSTPGDRRGIGSTGFFTMEPGELNEFDIALIFAKNYLVDSVPLAAKSILETRADSIRSYFNLSYSPCGYFIYNALEESKTINEISFNTYPNPVSNQLTLMLDAFENNSMYTVYDVLGNIISSNKISSKTTLIDLTSVSNGVYFIEVKNTITHSAKKLVVNHR